MKHTFPPASSFRSIWRNPIHFVAFGFGSGIIPVAPGTFGTLAAIPLYILMMHLPLVWYIVLTLVFIIASIIICDIASRDLGLHDHPGMVLDEIVGYLLTMVGAPLGVFWIFVGFVLFRIFDIWKPWPIRWIDRKVTGGLGIVLDDLLAAVYSLIILQLLAMALVYYD
ncbi:MAG TPA: phosphatidylglycerophosphatase A [Gammaproteobacteria bacterium]|nr:phosphatidylglycerophosphatase A [Gammaproteobacteria bacterium]